jgi:hypothetical protein
MPPKIRIGIVFGFFALIAFWVWTDGTSYDKHLEQIRLAWTKSPSVVVESHERAISDKYGTHSVYPATVQFDPGNGSDLASVELVFGKPQGVGQVIEIYHETERRSFGREHVETAETVEAGVTVDRQRTSSIFLVAGILCSAAAIGSIVLHFYAIRRRS